MKMISEFKAFAMKGNVIELAIGVVIGAAFGKIISSLIDDVITPLILKPALDKETHRLVDDTVPDIPAEGVIGNATIALMFENYTIDWGPLSVFSSPSLD